MIKLERKCETLGCLVEHGARLVEKYRTQKTAVWREPCIKKELSGALLAMSHNKCAYCEAPLGQTDSYMEVEHFHCKSLYPEQVLTWENLLPACKRCNTKKGEHDVEARPILNPADKTHDPKACLVFAAYQYEAREGSTLGQNTIDVLKLNDTERLYSVRYRMGENIRETINHGIASVERFLRLTTPHDDAGTDIQAQIMSLLKGAQMESAFGSAAATALFG